MIAICGLPTENFSQSLVDTAFNAYRDKKNRATLLASLAPDALYNAQIKMVGVWDTVGSLGVPDALFEIPDPLFAYLDTALHPDVHNAYQAVAIDEKRREFPPTLWTGPLTSGQVLEQVWFAGTHGDVGGGNPQTGLSDITLSWMLSKAVALGLEVDPAAAQIYLPVPVDPKKALDTLHTTWNLAWGFPQNRTIQSNSTIGNSVEIRLAHDTTYRPSNLQLNGPQLANTYAIETVVASPGIAITAGSSGR
jgi:hypothetical protein